jgi:phage shock protein A
MKARADAVQELEAAGTFDDITALGPGEDDIDRQLKSLSSKSAVDDDLAKLKGEIGAPPTPGATPTPGGGAGQLSSGVPSTSAEGGPAGVDPSKEQSA